MKRPEWKILNLGFVGGGDFCRDTLIKAYRNYSTEYISAKIVAVADQDPEASGMVLASNLGLFTTTDYHDLYDPKLAIDQILFFTPDESLFQEVLKSKPNHIRLTAYRVMVFFFDMLQVEERRLRAQSEELVTIFNGIGDGIAVIDNNYKIVKANRALLEGMGYEEKEVIGRNCHQVFHLSSTPCLPPDHPCPLSEAKAVGKPVHAIHTHLTLDGEKRIIDLTIHPTASPSGEIDRFVEITRDVTERYQAQEEMTRKLERAVELRTRQLEETHRKLIQQDKMTSLGKLSASVVHELNNPLTGILTFNRLIQRILQERKLTAEVIGNILDNLQLMEKETTRCSKIVSNLLAFARQSKIKPREADINKILQQILLLHSHNLALNDVKVTVRPEENLPPVFADVDQMQQVFMNLIFNATDAMADRPEKQLTLITNYDSEKDMVQIRVTDTGFGIPEEYLSDIFEPFFTTKKEGQGVGLGLSVVFGIIKEHRGQIDVEHTGPEGTTFLIEFPAYHAGTDGGDKAE